MTLLLLLRQPVAGEPPPDGGGGDPTTAIVETFLGHATFGVIGGTGVIVRQNIYGSRRWAMEELFP